MNPIRYICGLLFTVCLSVLGADNASMPASPDWDKKLLYQTPAVYPAEDLESEEVKGVYFEGLPYKGKPTRVFAWIGMPKVNPGQKVPGMALVHGGGGTAFAEWVRLWTARGYAAIAMDTCGAIPKGSYGKWERGEQGGPPGWGGWDQIDWPANDQWTYHAVADVILAHSLLRAQPEVDASRIGLTGISWGGYLVCIVAGLDDRFKFVVPVYGCGFTDEHNFAGSVKGLGPERGERWMQWWDPKNYLNQAKMPMLWVTGSNDFAYTPNALQKSYRLAAGSRTLCVRLRMPHGHNGPGEKPKEIAVFADSLVNKGIPSAKITGQGSKGSETWITFQSQSKISKVELNYTQETGNWKNRKWESIPAQLQEGKATASIPEGTKVYYFNTFDDRDCVVSSEHVELPDTEKKNP